MQSGSVQISRVLDAHQLWTSLRDILDFAMGHSEWRQGRPPETNVPNHNMDLGPLIELLYVEVSSCFNQYEASRAIKNLPCIPIPPDQVLSRPYCCTFAYEPGDYALSRLRPLPHRGSKFWP